MIFQSTFVMEDLDGTQELAYGSCSAHLQVGIPPITKCRPEGGRHKFTSNCSSQALSYYEEFPDHESLPV